MKKILFLSLITFSILVADVSAQIPNNQFENWTTATSYDSLNFWSTDNFLVSTCAQKEISNVQSGAISLKLTSSMYNFITNLSLPGAASTGSFIVSGTTINLAAGGQPDIGRHAFLKGYYKYTSVGGAHGSIESVLYKRNGSSRDTVASAIWSVNDTANYTFFSIPLIYNSVNNPDSSIVYFQSSGRTFSDLLVTGTIGSQLVIDSVYFDGTVGVNELPENLVSLASYPNPASEFLVIETRWVKPVKASISFLDMNGRLIQNIPLINTKQRIDLSSFSNGNYLYNLLDEDGNKLNSGKFSVNR